MTMRRRSLLLYLSAWAAVAVLTSAHALLVYDTEGPVSMTVVRYVAVTSSSYWLAWAVGGVVAVLAARRFPPMEQDGWRLHLVIHATLALVLTGLVLVAHRGLRLWAGVPPQLELSEDYVFRLSTGIPTYAILVGLVSAVEFRRRAHRAQREAAELSAHVTRARLDALQARIRPHFLYNTIHGIQTLVTEDPRRAEDMLGELGTVLRWVTDAPDAAELPLARELRAVEAYLRIQAVRFEDRLDVRMEVEPEARAALLPPLVLQPLVENAVEHGVARRRRGGCIEILARREGPRLTIRVRDDGPGLHEAGRGRPAPGSGAPSGSGGARSGQRDGVGLATTRSRLEAHYGKEASLRVEDRPEGGVVATLALPFRTSPTEGA